MRWGIQFALVLTACGAVAAERPSVGLVTEFPADASELMRSQFRRETERALAAAGVDLMWRDGADPVAGESFDRMVVLRFRGRCTGSAGADGRYTPALGLTHVSNNRVLPFVELDCPRIVVALDAGDGPFSRQRVGMLLGRALGRVAAHEIYHVLTASGAHDNEGLMKPSFDRRDLAGPELAFSRESLRRLRVSLGADD